MLRQIQSAQSCKPEARYTIKSTQRRPAGRQPSCCMAKAMGGKKKENLWCRWKKKPIYCFPKGHCVLYTAYCAQQQTYSCCARVSLDQPAAPTIELLPVLVQRVLVASCWEAKLSCCLSGVLSTLTDTSMAAGSAQRLPNLQAVNGKQTACPGRRRHEGANGVLTR